MSRRLSTLEARPARALLLAGVAALVMLLLLCAGRAQAETGLTPIGSFAPYGSDNGKLGLGIRDAAAYPEAAVQQSTGHLFVTDPGNNRVQVFERDGDSAAYLTQFGGGVLNGISGLAIDQADGSVYVGDGSGARIVKFVNDGGAIPSFSVDETFTTPAVGCDPGQIELYWIEGFAVDPTSGDLLVADVSARRVSRFGSDGCFKSSFDGSDSPGGAFTGPMDIAINSSGDVYVVDTTGDITYIYGGDAQSRVERFAADGSYKSTLAPLVLPAAVAVGSDDRVIVSTGQSSPGTGMPLGIAAFDDGDGILDATQLPASITGAMVTDVAVDGGRVYAVTSDPWDWYTEKVSIQLLEDLVGAPPSVETLPASDVTDTEARLNARIGAGNLETTFYAELGTTTSYGQRLPLGHDANLGDGRLPKRVFLNATDLQPGTTYHVRFVATNAEGAVAGADRTFTTDATKPAAVGLPDGRAYEMVSPVFKNGFDAPSRSTGGQDVRASVTGDRASFGTNGIFSDPDQGALSNTYVSSRTPDGWETRSTLPPVEPLPDWTFTFGDSVKAVAEDLDGVIAQHLVVERPLLAGDPLHTQNLYYRAMGSGAYTLLNPRADRAGITEVVDATPDLGHALAQSGQLPALPGHPGNVLYELTRTAVGPDRVEAVSVLPDGTVIAGIAGSACAGSCLGEGSVDNAVSDDGSKAFFTASNGAIYRRDTQADVSVQITASQRAGAPPVDPRGTFVKATPDGHAALFASPERLTDASEAIDTQADLGDLYLWRDGSSPALVDITPTAGGARVLGVAGVSEDLSRVWYVSRHAEGAGVAGAPNLYLWREGVGTRFVATLTETDPNGGRTPWLLAPGSRMARVTNDGRHLVVLSKAPLTGRDTAGTYQMYLFDSEAPGQVVCVSCGPNAIESSATFKDGRVSAAREQLRGGDQGRNISEDGRWIFFETGDSLVGKDVNGKIDVYRYETTTGEVSLISTGTGPEDSYFSDASRSGRDVFFSTYDRLVGWDVDGQADLYDARVGGGLPEPTPTAVGCDADACQGPSPGRPTLLEPATGAGGAAGDEKAVRPRAALRGVPAGARGALVRKGRATLTVSVTKAGAVKLVAKARIGGRTTVVGRTSTRARRAGRVKVTLRLSRAARRALSRAPRLRVSLSVSMPGQPEADALAIVLKGRGGGAGKASTGEARSAR